MARRICLIHWTPFVEGARSVVAIYELEATRANYRYWRAYVRSTLSHGETVEVSNPV